jgi:hypothetical protein
MRKSFNVDLGVYRIVIIPIVLFFDYLTIGSWLDCLVEKALKKSCARTVEIYQLSVVAIFTAIFLMKIDITNLLVVLVIWRLMEIFSFNMRSLFVKGGLISSSRAMVGTLIHLYEVVLCFSLLNLWGLKDESSAPLNVFYESLRTTATIGPTTAPCGDVAIFLSLVQIALSLFLTVITISGLVGLVRTEQKDSSKQA